MNIPESYKSVLSEFQGIYKKYLDLEEERKRKGEHNYNIFRELYGARSEVRVHSRFLGSLLNVDKASSHCQDDFFLKEFISACGLEDFKLNTKNTEVTKEYNNIDIYITDGKKHIIIENKIDACDQPQQILRYIQTIYNEILEKDKNLSPQSILNRIYVIYLSPNGRKPSDESLQKNGYGFEIIDDVDGYKLKSVFDKNNRSKGIKNWVYNLGRVKVNFKCISYETEILKWIENVKAGIGNLNDFNVIISQYKKVVNEVISGQEPAPVNEELVEFIVKNFAVCYELSQKDENDKYKYAKYELECAQMAENLNYSKQYLINDFFENYVYKELEKRLKNDENWELAEYIPLEKISWGNVIHIDPKINSKYFIHYVIQPVDSIRNVCWGVQKNSSDLPSIKDIIEEKTESFKVLGKQRNRYSHKDDWWVFWKYFYEDKDKDKEFALYLFENKNNFTEIAKEFCEVICETIKTLNADIKKIKDILAEAKIVNDE